MKKQKWLLLGIISFVLILLVYFEFYLTRPLIFWTWVVLYILANIKMFGNNESQDIVIDLEVEPSDNVSNSENRKSQALVEILKNIQSRITVDSSVGFTNYTLPIELYKEMEEDIKSIENGDFEGLKKYYLMFLPTSIFQEIAIANDWSEDYMLLAGEFDDIYNSTNT